MFFNQRDILIILVCIEIMLLSVSLNFIVFSVYLDDSLGQIFAIFVITVAAAEAAVGLGIFILYYKIKGDLRLRKSGIIRG
jgi:NADH-quinone oxidoreductase subunit K